MEQILFFLIMEHLVKLFYSGGMYLKHILTLEQMNWQERFLLLVK
jgi:hypothetical protein